MCSSLTIELFYSLSPFFFASSSSFAGLTTALTSYLDLGTGVLILYYGGILVMDGEMSVGELVTFQLFWNMMNSSYQNLQGLVTSFTRSAAGAEKVFSLWDNTPDIDPTAGKSVDWEVGGGLELKNVTFFYQMRPDNIVLSKINLKIPAGKVCALVGRSGGGKSTIISMLLRFYDPKEGSVSIDGFKYDGLKVNELRRQFGVVSQVRRLHGKKRGEEKRREERRGEEKRGEGKRREGRGGR